MNVYWHHNLFMHFFPNGGKGLSVCLSLNILPLRGWRISGTEYRSRPTHEQFQFGPLKVEWFDSRTEWKTGYEHIERAYKHDIRDHTFWIRHGDGDYMEVRPTGVRKALR